MARALPGRGGGASYSSPTYTSPQWRPPTRGTSGGRGFSAPIPSLDTDDIRRRMAEEKARAIAARAQKDAAKAAAQAAKNGVIYRGKISAWESLGSKEPGKVLPGQNDTNESWNDARPGQAYLFGAEGDYIVKRGYSVVPPENYRQWWTTPDRIDTVVPAVAYRTATEAKAHWFLLSPAERAYWDNAAASGVKYKGSGSKSGQALYGKMIDAAAAYNKAIGAAGFGGAINVGVKMDPVTGMPMTNPDGSYVFTNTYEDGSPMPAMTQDGKWTGFMDPETFLAWAIDNGTVTDGSAGNGSYGGGGGGGGGGTTYTQTNITTTLSSADEAKALLNNAAQNYLGRDATDDELAAFKKALNIREKKNPSKTVTKVTTDGSNSTAVTDVSGGVSADDKMQMGIDDAKDAEDYQQYQMARYFRMFEGALS